MEREKEAGARHQVQGPWSRERTSSILSAGREGQRGGTKVGMNNRVWEKAGSTNCQAWALRKCCLDRHPDCLFLTWQKSGPQASPSSKTWAESLSPASLGIFGGPIPVPGD